MTKPRILPTDAALPPDSAAASPLQPILQRAIEDAGGWLGFDAFMALALYAPGHGYYASGSRKFGHMPQSGSDFVTAPELSPHFGRALARQVGEALQATGTTEVWEFGAGSGALAEQLIQSLDAVGTALTRYTIVDLSGSLRERQQTRLAAYGERVRWVQELPASMTGVVVGNEVLDAMPVKLLARMKGVWHERGVVLHDGELVFADRPTELRPTLDIDGPQDYLTETHAQAEGFVRTLADRLAAGAIFLLDYGFPEHEYFHPQRSMGTLMCHQGHLADSNPLLHVGLKDITAHVNFTGVAVAAQDAGLEVLGYTCQAHFLMNCGIADALQAATQVQRIAAQRLILEHEMGEFFKVIGLTKGAPWDAIGFSRGDKTHRL